MTVKASQKVEWRRILHIKNISTSAILIIKTAHSHLTFLQIYDLYYLLSADINKKVLSNIIQKFSFQK